MIEMYTKPTCPYCVRAKGLLESKGLTITERRIDLEPELKDEMIARTGRHTVPQIFINDRHIGGCDDLYALEESGELTEILRSI
ncbi:MAG: glutaredoxin 3 [Legionellales bacterium]|nr:glutaredoxin 3 [Legionellales bacterium]|tara:strand:- start:19765 stop:20016 length:252 start_codon:yes stop_codon:yes gene_type:complete